MPFENCENETIGKAIETILGVALKTQLQFKSEKTIYIWSACRWVTDKFGIQKYKYSYHIAIPSLIIENISEFKNVIQKTLLKSALQK